MPATKQQWKQAKESYELDGLSQTQIADNIGVSRQTVGKRVKREGWRVTSGAAEDAQLARQATFEEARAAAETAWYKVRENEADHVGILAVAARQLVRGLLIDPENRRVRTRVDSLDLQRATLSLKRLVDTADVLSGASSKESDLSAVRQFISFMSEVEEIE